jgi:hypothetical protein
VLSCEAYGLDSAELDGLKMSMREPRDTPRLRLPFLKTIIRFGKDEQALSLNDKSFFVVVDLPFPICARLIFLTRLFQHAFHPSDIAAQILMLCLVNNFMPPSTLTIEICCRINTMQPQLWSTMVFGLFSLRQYLTEKPRFNANIDLLKRLLF